jgi:uncharacterized protein YPO0396
VARRAFFSFHYERDIWRANIVRNSFQLVIVATVQNTTTIQPYIDSVIIVSKTDASASDARPIASATAASIAEFADLRSRLEAPISAAAPP